MADNEFVLCGPVDDSPLPANSFGAHLLRRIRCHGDAVAQVFAETFVARTFREILREGVGVQKLVASCGVVAGEGVVVLSRVSPECLPAMLGILWHGAVFMPLNPDFTNSEMLHMLTIMQPKLILAERRTLWRIEGVRRQIDSAPLVVKLGSQEPATDDECDSFEVQDDESQLENVATVMASSGTTGLPKGVMMTNKAWLKCFATEDRAEHSKKTGLQIMTFLLTSPPFWGSGVSFPVLGVCRGFRIVLLRNFEEEPVMKAIQDYKLSSMFLTPNQALSLSSYPSLKCYDLSSLKLLIVAGSSMTAESQRLVQDRLKVPIYQSLGMSEAMRVTEASSPFPYKVGSVGKLARNVQAKVVDVLTGKSLGPNAEGELVLKSPSITAGYINNPSATAQLFDAHGWLHTGDVVYYDEEGFIFVVDRIKELIKYKGHHVPAAELEAVLLRHPGVKQAVVVGKPHEADMEHPTAFVLKHPHTEVTEEELIKLVKDNLSEIKWLRGGVKFIEKLPLTPSGKVLRRELKANLV